MPYRNSSTFVLAMAAASLMWVSPASADEVVDTSALREAVTVEGVRAHQQAFQDAADANGGTRAAGTGGYDDSAAYVAAEMEAAGYNVTVQEFDFLNSRSLGPSILEQVAPGLVLYVEDTDYNVMSESEPGDVVAPATAVDLDLGLGNGSTSGCEAADFAGFPAGDIALIQRGACSFQLKAENASDAGAVGAIIFNQGNSEDRKGLINATLSADYTGGIPVLFATYDRGVEWSGTSGLQLHMFANVLREIVTTSNVLAETPGGRDDRVVVVGAHLDSVPEGPGIQDNGSGSAAILEIARQISLLGIEPRNQIRFAWWGAEESGLVGSQLYVDTRSKREIKDIALNLNFDMIGSPNFVRFVYDGDGSSTPLSGPTGSANIEKVFEEYFNLYADELFPLAFEPTAFDGRSDYGPFIAVGIPAGGLFTGAEGIKTEDQVAVYGGTAGEQYDPCYHLACDTFDNINLQALDQNSDAAAHSVLSFAMTKSAVSGASRDHGQDDEELTTEEVGEFEYLGDKLQK